LREAIALGERAGERRALAGAMTALAMLLRVEGDFAAAEPLYRDVVRLAREAGDRETENVGTINLSMIRAEAGDLAGALDAARESLAIAAEIRTMQALHSALEVCAGLAASRGDGAQAATMFGAAEAFAARTGVKRDAADEAFLAPRIARARSALGAAAFEAAAREGGAMPLEGAADLARRWLETARPLLEA